MILNFDKEIAALRAAGVTIPDGKEFEVCVVLFMTYDRGFAQGRDHAVRIVQRRALNPMPIVEEIRRPVR